MMTFSYISKLNGLTISLYVKAKIIKSKITFRIYDKFKNIKGQLHEIYLNLHLVNCIFFPIQWFKLHLSIYLKLIFYQIILKLSRLQIHNLVIYATYMTFLFSQKLFFRFNYLHR